MLTTLNQRILPSVVRHNKDVNVRTIETKGKNICACLETELKPIASIIASEEPLRILRALITCPKPSRQHIPSPKTILHHNPIHLKTKGNIPLLTTPGLSASLGAASPPRSKCAQILALNSTNSSGEPILKHGCRGDFSSFVPGAICTCWPEVPMSNQARSWTRCAGTGRGVRPRVVL